MNARNFSLVLAIAAMSVSSVSAQGDFFFSFGEGGANADQTSQQFYVGDTGYFVVYWSTNGPNDSDLSVGAFIDVFSSAAGVIEFTAAETFDYAVSVGGQSIGNRLLDVNGGGGSIGPADSVTADFIDEMSAFTVTGGPGILEANNGKGAFLDEGYDATNDGFKWGRIDFNVIGAGTTDITGAAGDGQIVNGGDVVPAVFTTLTVTVARRGCAFDIGDVNQDGSIDRLDVGPFVDLISTGQFLCEADINEDGAVNLLDVGPFVELLSGG